MRCSLRHVISSNPRVYVLIPNDVVLSEVAARLHLDQDEIHFARVLHPVGSTQRYVDGLIFANETDVAVNRHASCSLDHNPMLGSVVM